MKLAVREWGPVGGPRAALVHGITGDASTWERVAGRLAARGWRVLAPDLRGHGASPRGTYSVQEWADDLVETLPAGLDLAVGHSLGGLVLAAAVDGLDPRLAVYEDPAWVIPVRDHAGSVAFYTGQATWTEEDVRRVYPRWGAPEVAAKLAALRGWDPATAPGLMNGSDAVDAVPTGPPRRPSLVMLADPSALVPPDRAAALAAVGWEVETVPGAGHSIHRDDPAAFLATLERWLAAHE